MNSSSDIETGTNHQSVKRVTIVGSGLVGGSLGLGLRKQGIHVSVVDQVPEVESKALDIGAADQIGWDYDADLIVIATPVGLIPDLAKQALSKSEAFVTDVGSTKAEICQQVSDPRFVGGHPMAGSELDGIEGARADLFDSAIWILTPDEDTDEDAFTAVRKMVTSLNADCITLAPEVHDSIVASVSHLPHLTAATLMNLAADSADEHAMFLRLAAGGFRDMTRISAGRSNIWPDICFANNEAIVNGLDELINSLQEVRQWVAMKDRKSLLNHLDSARIARMNLPNGFGPTSQISEVMIPVKNKAGEVAKITKLAAEESVNIIDLEISHSAQGTEGIMILLVDSKESQKLVDALKAIDYTPQIRALDAVKG